MNLASVQYPVFNPYQQATVEIYIQGCKRCCKGCHNPELVDFSKGLTLDAGTTLTLLASLVERENLFDIISITGGDLLCQDLDEASKFIKLLKERFPTKSFWLFTGAELADIPGWCLQEFSVIKTGVYNEELKVEGFPASTNQKVLKQGVDY